ncbi:uncharacterized protein LOC113522199 [Galleria mellonella]|uniref:Uncharacterized protein LOC113522199 n=1 Tax=Galleria mellonella TaxID=7137 RepID=A0ABM3MIC7_GALME|nr:uncharacterized protein LOC113522199 [Galleria mellonella]
MNGKCRFETTLVTLAARWRRCRSTPLSCLLSQSSVKRGHATRLYVSLDSRARSVCHLLTPNCVRTMTEQTQYSILRISDEKTLELIDLYRKEQCLWNTSIQDYRNREKRAKAAARIAKKLNIENFEARHVMIKFKNLRNSYCQELKKIANSLINSSGEETDAYKPTVIWFNKMDSFIRPHLQFKHVPSQAKLVINNGVVKRETETVDDSDDSIWSKNVTADLLSVPGSSQDDTGSENDSESSAGKAVKRARDWSVASSKRLRMEENELLTDSMETKVGEDCFDSFGKYIAALLRTLPQKKAIVLQPQIVSLIASAVLNNGDAQ